MKHIFTIEIEYSDETSFFFDVILEGKEHEYMAHLMQITRGTLMASSASRATAYNQDGFNVCAYTKK